MKNHHIWILGIIVFIIVFQGSGSASAFQVSITPNTLNPGDAFVITVKEIKNCQEPSVILMKRELPLTRCGDGCFLAIGAVDIKQKAGIYTIKVKAGKRQKQMSLRIRKTIFQKIYLTLPAEKVFPKPEDLEIIQDEKVRLQSLFHDVSSRKWDGSFIMPLDNDISMQFGTKRIMNRRWTSVHRGIDIRGGEGEEVGASNNGIIVLAEELFYGGNTVIIDHGQGIFTLYMHLSGFTVNAGDAVSMGDSIGYVGSSGRSTGPHLHFGVQIRGISVNPVSLTALDL
jgi:murein DD-endopeptidase MepM/ murein hydrolase activator NlpD